MSWLTGRQEKRRPDVFYILYLCRMLLVVVLATPVVLMEGMSDIMGNLQKEGDFISLYISVFSVYLYIHLYGLRMYILL